MGSQSSLTAKPVPPAALMHPVMHLLATTVDTPIVHPTYVRMLCATLRRHGVDVDAVLRAADVGPWSEMATSETLLDHRRIKRLIAQALQASGRPGLGLEVGATVQISAHGPLGFAAIASRDLLQAWETVARFGGLRYGAVQYRLVRENGGAVMELIERMDLADTRTFVSSMMFAAMVRVSEAVLGSRLDRLVVDLPFPQPLWHEEITRLCVGTVRYNAQRLVFRLDEATLTHPGITADPKAYALACQQCEQLLAQAERIPLAQRVGELLGSREGHYPTLTELAATFHLSQRTLIRRLKAEGSSYQALLDASRQQRAMWYLTQTHHSVEEIAARLGYTDTTNFSRTFRRWFGKAPGDVRRSGPVA